jgi:hypothetical protein
MIMVCAGACRDIGAPSFSDDRACQALCMSDGAAEYDYNMSPIIGCVCTKGGKSYVIAAPVRNHIQ